MTAPRCNNPNCDQPAAMGLRGRFLKYCANPNCRKQAWYVKNLSAKSRKTTADILAEVRHQNAQIQADVDYIKGTLSHAPPQQLPLFTPTPPPSSDLDLDDERFATTVIQAQTNEDMGANFRISMARLNGEQGLLKLPLADVEYGVQQGMIPPAILEKKRAAQPPQPSAKPLAGASLALPTPDFDDLDLDF